MKPVEATLTTGTPSFTPPDAARRIICGDAALRRRAAMVKDSACKTRKQKAGSLNKRVQDTGNGPLSCITNAGLHRTTCPVAFKVDVIPSSLAPLSLTSPSSVICQLIASYSVSIPHEVIFFFVVSPTNVHHALRYPRCRLLGRCSCPEPQCLGASKFGLTFCRLGGV